MWARKLYQKRHVSKVKDTDVVLPQRLVEAAQGAPIEDVVEPEPAPLPIAEACAQCRLTHGAQCCPEPFRDALSPRRRQGLCAPVLPRPSAAVLCLQGDGTRAQTWHSAKACLNDVLPSL